VKDPSQAKGIQNGLETKFEKGAILFNIFITPM
jgi:hypothetical protein